MCATLHATDFCGAGGVSDRHLSAQGVFRVGGMRAREKKQNNNPQSSLSPNQNLRSVIFTGALAVEVAGATVVFTTRLGISGLPSWVKKLMP